MNQILFQSDKYKLVHSNNTNYRIESQDFTIPLSYNQVCSLIGGLVQQTENNQINNINNFIREKLKRKIK